MDLRKLQTFESLIPPATGKVNTNPGIGPSFKETLENVAPPTASKETLNGIVKGANPLDSSAGIKFSNHAIERMKTRGISFNAEDIGRLNEAVSKAAAKGSKDSLVLMNDSALIVSVKNNTVVTVMDKAALKENVFTNIDSTIVM